MDHLSEWFREEQQRFEREMLGLARAMAFKAIRRNRIRDWEPFLDDVQALAWMRWRSLRLRGLEPQEIGVWGIVNRVVRSVLAGATASPKTMGRNAGEDLYKRRDRRPLFDRAVSRSKPDVQATLNVDYATWLATQNALTQVVLNMFGFGATTEEVAEFIGRSVRDINQIRNHAWKSWQEYNEK